MKQFQNTFYNAQSAFEYFYKEIQITGIKSSNTLFCQNVGFYIFNPKDNLILTEYRKWKKEYAEYEWQWYLAKNRSVEEIKKKAKIWDTMHNGDNIVWSNYGWQWERNNQLNKVIKKLKDDPETRQAFLTIYDGKEISEYEFDTPCTLSIGFCIIDNLLNMSVLMRSNDLWYGFCNDQFCFSNLQIKVAKELNINTGWYYHFSNNLHLYNSKLNKIVNK